MPRGPSFSQRDVTAAIRLAERTTGRAVIRVEIGNDGRIIVELAAPAGFETTPAQDHNPFDDHPLYGSTLKARQAQEALGLPEKQRSTWTITGKP